MFNKAGMGDLMKKAQEMQENMKKAQAEIANTEVVGESGAGLVKITLLGNHNVRKVDMDDSLMEDDKEMLEDLMAAAVNDATQRLETQTREMMAGATEGLQLPPGMKMPF